MRSRLSILSLGATLIALPASAQVPAPGSPPISPEYLLPFQAPPGGIRFSVNVNPHSPQATLTGVPLTPPAPPMPGFVMQGPSGLVWTAPGFLTLAAPVPMAPAKPKTRVFEVADLIHAPLQVPGAATLGNTKGTAAHTLMKMVAAMAKPESWERHGGTGKIEYIAASDCLCATNTPDALAEMEKVLAGLRRMQDQQVVVEVQLMTAPAGFGAKAGWPTPDDKGKASPMFQTPAEMKKALAAATADKQVQILTMPKITVTDGQESYFETHRAAPASFPSGAPVQPVSADSYYIGTRFACTPTVSMDNKSVRLQMHSTHVCPVGAGGWQVQSHQNDTTATLPTGHTAVAYLGKQTVEETTETTRPVLSKLPVLGRLFTVHGVRSVEQEVYQVVTVRVIDSNDKERSLKAAYGCDAGPVTSAPCCQPKAGCVGAGFGFRFDSPTVWK